MKSGENKMIPRKWPRELVQEWIVWQAQGLSARSIAGKYEGLKLSRVQKLMERDRERMRRERQEAIAKNGACVVPSCGRNSLL